MNPLRALVLQLSRIPIGLLLVMIIVLAGVIATGVTTIINDLQTKLKNQQDEFLLQANATGKAVYAIHDIAEGQPIPGDALEEKEIQKSKIPEDAIASIGLAIGRLTKYGIFAGQIVSQHDLAPQGISLGFESKLREGMRAVAFGIDNNSGVSGFVTPDSHVDIVAMVGTGADTKASAILSDVEIIAVGQSYQKSPGQTAAMPSSSVTVSVSTEDTTKLIKAISASKLYLALRSSKDHSPVATVDVTSMFPAPSGPGCPVPSITALEPPVLHAPDLGAGMPDATNPAARSPVPQYEIEVWSGSKKDVLTFPGG